MSSIEISNKKEKIIYNMVWSHTQLILKKIVKEFIKIKVNKINNTDECLRKLKAIQINLINNNKLLVSISSIFYLFLLSSNFIL